MKVCYVCKLELPIEAFPTITVRDKRCKPGHAWTGPSSDCRECRKAQRREWRRKKALAAGKVFAPRGDRETWEEQQRIEGAARRAKQKLERRIAWAICLAFRSLVKLTPRERTVRQVARDRARRHRDPAYRDVLMARKVKRKRAVDGARVEPVSLLAVAERDGWCCRLCGGSVTRNAPMVRDRWSMDHVVPLSKGGPHTYDNVVLAHRGCNSSKGSRVRGCTPGVAKGTSGADPALRVAEPREVDTDRVSDV